MFFNADMLLAVVGSKRYCNLLLYSLIVIGGLRCGVGWYMRLFIVSFSFRVLVIGWGYVLIPMLMDMMIKDSIIIVEKKDRVKSTIDFKLQAKKLYNCVMWRLCCVEQ